MTFTERKMARMQPGGPVIHEGVQSTRPLAVLTVLAALSLLVTACGGGPAHNGVASPRNPKTTTTQSSAAAGSSSSGQSGPTEAQLLKYAECIRSHGEPNFPGRPRRGAASPLESNQV